MATVETALLIGVDAHIGSHPSPKLDPYLISTNVIGGGVTPDPALPPVRRSMCRLGWNLNLRPITLPTTMYVLYFL